MMSDDVRPCCCSRYGDCELNVTNVVMCVQLINAVVDFAEELELDAKYYYRRGIAKSAMKDHRGGYADLKKAQSMLPSDVAVAKQVKEVKG